MTFPAEELVFYNNGMLFRLSRKDNRKTLRRYVFRADHVIRPLLRAGIDVAHFCF
jgi:hypothetical protein